MENPPQTNKKNSNKQKMSKGYKQIIQREKKGSGQQTSEKMLNLISN